MSEKQPSRVIFIGNIPYGLTEEQVVHTFSTVGQVLSFRLVYDPDTGRPKGFGFCEFADAEAAASAVRNLNGHEVMGRELRVDFSHQQGGNRDNDNTTANQNATQHQAAQAPAPPNGYVPPPPGALPPLPAGIDLPAGLSCPDAISKTLSTIEPAQLLDILSQMKGLVMGDPARATELLKQAPQLAYAIFQGLLLMGLVDTSVLASVVESSGQAPSVPANQPLAPPPQHQAAQQLPPRPPQSYQPPPQQFPQYPPMPGQMHVPTPPAYGQPYQPPPVPQPAQQAPAPSEQQLMQQVMQMTQQQIDQLPPNERGQIIALRAQLGVR